MPGRKPKYSPEIAKILISVMSETGSDKAAYEAAGIGRGTFYRWLTEKQELREGVAKAKEDFRKTTPEAIVKQAQKSLRDYLFLGHIETWTSKTVVRDGVGNVIQVTERVSKSIKPTPHWVIERVLGKQMDEMEALKVLAEAGWIPTDVLSAAGTGVEDLRRVVQRAFQKQATIVSDE